VGEKKYFSPSTLMIVNGKYIVVYTTPWDVEGKKKIKLFSVPLLLFRNCVVTLSVSKVIQGVSRL
jgi:hypothetical protein